MQYLVYRKCPVCKYEHEFLLGNFTVYKQGVSFDGEEKDAKNFVAKEDLKITKGAEVFRLKTDKKSSGTFGGPINSTIFEIMICPDCGVWMDNRATVTKI